MVGNGNHPLSTNNDSPCVYDDLALEEYVLTQMLPQDEEVVRQHLVHCSYCRGRVATLQHFHHDLQVQLHRELEKTTPGPQLSFDAIASEWNKPPRRVSLWFRLQRLLPNPSYILVMSLFVLAFLLLIPSANTAALRELELVDRYDGPAAVVAAATDEGLVIIQLDPERVEIIAHVSYMHQPRDLQFSPDGHWLAGQQGRTLHIIETRATGAHMRIALGDTARWSWSPDSSTLAYTDGRGQLAAFDVNTLSNRILVPAAENAWGLPVWNADGLQLAYAVVVPLPGADSTPDQQGIWRLALDTGFRVEVARNPQPDTTLLLPDTWVNDTTLLAWDVNASITGTAPAVYRVDAYQHTIAELPGQSHAQGIRLAWPVSAQGFTLTAIPNNLILLDVTTGDQHAIGNHVPQPASIAWAPNSAWLAYTVTGAAGGKGLYLLSLDESTLRSLTLPGKALEKAVSWAGPEHLFVIRQRENSYSTELWLVSVTTDAKPQRILTNIQMPATGPYQGWRWEDVLATRILAPSKQ